MTAPIVRRLFRLHKWTGWLASLPVCILCLTGAILVLRQDIEWPAARTGGEARLSAIVAGADQPTAIEYARRDGFAARVYTAKSGTFWVDQSGMRPVERNGGASILEWLARLHRRFDIPNPTLGRWLVALAGLALTLSAVSGALVYRRFLRGVLRLGKPFWHIRRTRVQLVWSDWHKLVGVVSLLFSLIAGSTGLVLAVYRNGPGAMRVPKAVKGVLAPGEGISVDRALEAAESALPGMKPTLVLLPGAKAPRFTFYARFPAVFVRNAASFVVVDARDGSIADVYDARTDRTALMNWMEPLHYGYWGGRAADLLYVVFSLFGAFLAISGPVIRLYKLQKL